MPIASAPATATPVPSEAPTATAPPTPSPDPTATAEPVELSEEEAILAAWERYLNLGFAVRSKDPSADALDLDAYVAGDARARIEELLVEQETGGYYVQGEVRSTGATIDQRSASIAVVEDCVSVKLTSYASETQEELTREQNDRFARGRIEDLPGGWRLTAFETGKACGA